MLISVHTQPRCICARRLFPPEHKARIRDRCMAFLDETDDIVRSLLLSISA